VTGLGGRIVLVGAANRGHDVDRADLDRGEDHGNEGDHHAEAVADHQRPRRHVGLDEVEAAGHTQEHGDQAERSGHAGNGADESREQAVDHALGDVRLHEA